MIGECLRRSGGGLVRLHARSTGRASIARNLADFAGVLQADAFAGYAALYRGGTIQEACLHGPRSPRDP